MISTVILIHAEFDIARGCKTLRSHITSLRWQPVVGARATAALTAMGDLILNSHSGELVPVNLTIQNSGSRLGIELGCSFYLPNGETPEVCDGRQRLDRASDEMDFYETSGNIQVIARLNVT